MTPKRSPSTHPKRAPWACLSLAFGLRLRHTLCFGFCFSHHQESNTTGAGLKSFRDSTLQNQRDCGLSNVARYLLTETITILTRQAFATKKALPVSLLHASAARVESKNLEIRLVETWGRACGKMIVEEQYESSTHSANLKTPPPCFKYILLYIPGGGLLHDMGTLHLLHPRCCDRSLRGKGVGMAASSCGTPQVKCHVLTSVCRTIISGTCAKSKTKVTALGATSAAKWLQVVLG